MFSIVKALWQDENKVYRFIKTLQTLNINTKHPINAHIQHKLDHLVVPIHQIFGYVLLGPRGWHIDFNVASLC